MNVQDLIESLQNAKGPDRRLDVAIALLVGYQRVEVLDGEGEQRTRLLFLAPSTNDPAKVPDYTRSIDAAYRLAQTLAPSHSGGCSWEDGMGSARISDGPYCQAANPAIALCVATLSNI